MTHGPQGRLSSQMRPAEVRYRSPVHRITSDLLRRAPSRFLPTIGAFAAGSACLTPENQNRPRRRLASMRACGRGLRRREGALPGSHPVAGRAASG